MTESGVTKSDEVPLATLKQQRATSKASITRIKNIVHQDNSLSYIELECRLGMVDSYFKQVSYYQAQIEKQDFNDDARPELDELYFVTKSKIMTLIEERKPRDAMNPEQSIIVSAPVQKKLPILKLPHFDGKYMEYKNFICSFNNMVHNNSSLTKIEKFNHLLSCLGGDALSTVKAFRVTEDNYDLAIARLKERFDNDTLIFLESISALFDVPAVPKPDSKQLHCTVDTISAIFNSLKALGNSDQILEGIMIHLVMSKVDAATKKQWQEKLSFTELPKWADFNTMLDKRCQQLDAQVKSNQGESSNLSKSSNKVNNNNNKKNPKQYTLVATSNDKDKSERICSFCNKGNHTINICQHFIALPTKDKKEKVKQLRLCFNCLAKGHNVSECPSKFSCRFCKERHHSLLHLHGETSTVQVTSTSVASDNEQQVTQTSASVYTASVKSEPASTKGAVILATAKILIQDSSGRFHSCRALLDSCSQSSLLTYSMANLLNLRKEKAHVDVCGVGGSSVKLNCQTQTTIRSRLSDVEQTVEFLLTHQISGYHPNESIAIEKLNLPTNIDLADPEFNISKGIDALLDADVFFSLLKSGRISLGKDLPALIQTELGWIVGGKYVTTINNSPKVRNFCTTLDTLNSNVEKLWELENIDTKVVKFTNEQQQCEEHFAKTVQVSDENRIIVRLPFKGSPDVLGNSRDIATKRFYWLEKRLDKNPSLKQDYASFLKEYEELGHMTLVKNPDLSRPHFFIPHHCVIKLSSETTKLRVVFDASCRSASQVSLNDLLMVGPTLQNELYITLIRFRQHQYGLMADISKMYRQVMLKEDDRRFQLILWRTDKNQPLSTYMLNTVTYGTAAAPYLAIKSLQYATEICPYPHELGKSIINNDFYVDDMVTGADDLPTLRQIKHEVSEILSYVKMDLCKWHCSHPQLSTCIDRDLQLDEETKSALGVKWNTSRDEFVFSFQAKQEFTVFTKRSILSFTSSFFDPLGLINPVIVVPRIILQQLWILKLEWDEPIPQAIEHKFKEFLNDLQNLSSVHIPRFVSLANTVNIQIHGFCDASSKAYGCCVYIRSEDSSGTVSTKLLTSKSRLAPIKTSSLPRLELCSAHILVKLWAKIQPHLSFEISEIHFWSDSQIALHWIRSESATLSVFVGNRVADIQNLSKNINWHHIASASNPADLISRGCSVKDLQTTLWLNGPTFLQEPPTAWPLQSTSTLTDNQLTLEKKKMCFINQQETLPVIIKQIHQFSNYLKCVRVFAYVLRWVNYQRLDMQVISAPEMKNALYHIIWAIQRHHFAKEISLLEDNKQITGSLSNLSLFLDKFKNLTLLRVGGRLENAEIPPDVKHPLLLPKSDHFVVTLVTHIHRTNFHAGPRALTALVQQEFWVVNCKSLATQVVHNCIHCTRYKPKLLTQVMGNLPKERVNASLPFTITGVDFAGPIPTYLKIRGKTPYKSYIAVFVCFASKAVHLEAVTDLSADAFIAALKRFVGRRGMPEKIFCDNATNFVGADNKLKEFSNFFNQTSTVNKIVSHCADQNIDFSFIPPRAPHFGGLWEAAVKVAKTHLYKTLHNARLTFEELSTALVEIEAVMNSRPITCLSSNPNDFSVLTPGELLIGRKLKDIPEPVDTAREVSYLERWKRITAVKQHFWQRWHKEYLFELQLRNRWQYPSRNLQVGDLVTIHDDNLPPMKWLIGRVVRVIKGADEKIRVAEIQTASSRFLRPITKLAILPVLNQNDSMGAGMLSQPAIEG